MKKSINENFIDFLIKKKIVNDSFKKKPLDFDKFIIKGMVEYLKKNETINLGEFGFLKKVTKVINNEKQKYIDFIPKGDIEKSISKKFKSNKADEDNKQKKFKQLIGVLIFLVILAGLITAALFVFSPDINKYVDDYKIKVEQEKIAKLNDDLSSTTLSDMSNDKSIKTAIEQSSDLVVKTMKDNGKVEKVADDNAIAKKETIDYTDKKVSTNTDKSIIVKTQPKNDTNLKQGEYTAEIVEIDGKKYDKYTYIIKKGDTLWWIADRFLFDPLKWPIIHKDNTYILNPNLIEPDYKLVIYTTRKPKY